MSGRVFSPKYEVESIHRGIDRDLTRFSGTQIPWFRLDRTETRSDNIYDYGEGRVWRPPVWVYAIDAAQTESPEQVHEQGLYTRDRLRITFSHRELERVGFEEMMVDHRSFLQDRVVYDRLVYSPGHIRPSSEVGQRGLMVVVTAEQVRGDELVNDPTFHKYARPSL